MSRELVFEGLKEFAHSRIAFGLWTSLSRPHVRVRIEEFSAMSL